MAWVGWSQLDVAHLQPVASWGDDQGILAGMSADTGLEPGRDGQDCLHICNNLLVDGVADISHEALISSGIRACAVFPILSKGRATGALGSVPPRLSSFRSRRSGCLQRSRQMFPSLWMRSRKRIV